MRLDEFARVPDGVIDSEDRTRFTCIGFDILSSAPTPASGSNTKAAIIKKMEELCQIQ